MGAARVAEVEQIQEAQRAATWAAEGAIARSGRSANMRQQQRLEPETGRGRSQAESTAAIMTVVAGMATTGRGSLNK